MIEYALLYLAFLGVAGFALVKGDRAERLGATWLFLNVAAHTVLQACGERSTTFHLVMDGIYATGLLPLAFLFVSWWVGVQAFLACAGFCLQAAYLLFDRPIDQIFIDSSNLLFVASLLNLIVATSCSMWHRRTKSGAPRGLATA